MEWFLELLELRWLSRVRLGLYYRQIVWIVAAVAGPVFVMGYIALGDTETSRNRILLVGGAGLLIALFMGWMNARYLSRPVRSMTVASRGIARGEVAGLDDSRHVERGDELGEMALAFQETVAYIREIAAVAQQMAAGNFSTQVQPKSDRDILGQTFVEMAEGLGALIGEVGVGANTLAEGSTELARSADRIGLASEQTALTIQQVAHGNEEQARGASETSSFVAELSKAMGQIAEDTRDQALAAGRARDAAAKIAESAKDVASRVEELQQAGGRTEASAKGGAETVLRTVEKMRAIMASVETSGARIQELRGCRSPIPYGSKPSWASSRRYWRRPSNSFVPASNPSVRRASALAPRTLPLREDLWPLHVRTNGPASGPSLADSQS